jgi:peptidoglycan/LPS O-acetylase OafA/YrhL
VKRSEPLDGLRGAAVLLVLVSHASNAGHHVLPGLDARGVGRAGVFLFFVLSSYLLTSQVLGRLDRGEPVRWGRFAARRFLRVMPAYALCMGAHVALGAFTAAVALRHLGLVRAEAHFWTIPVEVLFYLSLPAIGLGLSRLRGTAARVALLLVASAVARALFPPDFPAKAPDYRPNVAPFLPIFLGGSVLAVLGPRIAALRGAPARAVRIAGWVALAVLFALTPSVWGRIVGEPVHHTRFHLWFDAHTVLWMAVVAACIVEDEGGLRRAVSVRPLRALGWISYSAYLFHAMVLVHADAWLAGRVPAWSVGPLFLAASLAVGGASFVLVERPFLELLRGEPSVGPEHR